MPLVVRIHDTPTGRSLPLTEGTLLIGRAADCAIRLDDPNASRHHASLRVEGDRVWVRDLGSRNGTVLEDADLTAETEWQPGQRLFVAGVLLELTDTAGEMQGRTQATFIDDVLSASQLSELSASDTQAQTGDEVDRVYHAMAAAGELLARPREPSEMTEPVLDLVERALKPERVALLLHDGPGGALAVHASRAPGGAPVELLALSSTLVRRVLEERTSFLVGDALADPALRDQDSIIRARVRTALVVPLFDSNEVLGILYADRSDPRRPFQRDDLRILALLGNLIAMALTQARLRLVESERQRLADELVAARSVLAGIICADPPAPAGWQVCPYLEPCSEVGGDFYDVHQCRHGGWGVLLGDVSGHGLGAALLVAQIVPVARMLLDEHADPARVLCLLNEHVCRTTAPHQFATVFLGVLDPASGELMYANAGHMPPAHLGPDGAVARLAPGGLPVGILPDLQLKTSSCRLAVGDVLFVCSDGVTESSDPDGDMFGDTRTCEVLAAHAGAGAAGLRDALLAALAQHRGPAVSDDDVAMLVVARE
jgi:sigma-B regulation protein RsbU (phosphoserine phosphatase)